MIIVVPGTRYLQVAVILLNKKSNVNDGSYYKETQINFKFTTTCWNTGGFMSEEVPGTT